MKQLSRTQFWQKHKKIITILLGVILPALIAISVAVGVVFNKQYNDSAVVVFKPLTEEELVVLAPQYDYKNYKDEVQQKNDVYELEKDEVIIRQLLLQEWKPYLFKTKDQKKRTYHFFNIKDNPQKDDIDQVLTKISKYLWSWADNRKVLLNLAKLAKEKKDLEPLYRLYSTNRIDYHFLFQNDFYQSPIEDLIDFQKIPISNTGRKITNYEDKLQELTNTHDLIKSEETVVLNEISSKDHDDFAKELEANRKEIDNWLIAFYMSISNPTQSQKKQAWLLWSF